MEGRGLLGTSGDCPQQTDGWYLVARDGDLVLRVRSGMQLGEDDTGELTLDPPDPQVALTVTDDGRLEVAACSDRRLELDAGHPESQIRLERHTRAKLHLANNVIALTGDFPEAALTAETAVTVGDDAGELGGIIVLPEPVAESAPAPPEAPALTATPAGPDPVAAAARTDRETDSDGAPAAVEPGAPARPKPAPNPARPRRIAIAIAAALAAAALWPLIGLDPFRAPAPQPEVPAPAGAERQAPATPAGAPPAVGHALASVDALLADQRQPAPAALAALAASLEALLATAPGDPRLRQRLETINQRLANLQEPPHADADAGAPPPDAAAAVEPAAARPPVELVLVPPIRHKPMPVRPEPVAVASAEPVQPAVRRAPAAIDLASFQVDRQEAERLRANAVQLANERALRAAADALERGWLVTPVDGSAYTLYSRVLAADPNAEIARIGIQSIRGQLIGRVRSALAADDVRAAMTALEEAATAGAEPTTLAELREAVEYRQRLLDAKTGRPGILFPITELTAIRQDPPGYPRHAPAGAEGTVEVEMTVTETGQVRDVEVLGDPPMYFLRATKLAVQEWRFSPVLLRGEPVAVRTSARVTFRPEAPDGS